MILGLFAMPCKYQRIVRNGRVVQPGDIDTPAKFRQLMDGIDIEGKSFLDVGCNCGEMCRLAKEAGAKQTLGIDTNRDYVHQARELSPGLTFHVDNAHHARGAFDVVLASAMLHYVGDYRRFFQRMARVTNEVLTLDAWLTDRADACFVLTKRGMFIPSEAALRAVAVKWFGVVENRGPALSPDASKRSIFHLRKPRPALPRAVLIYGQGGSGKTTHATELLEHEHLQLDQVFISWYRAKRMSSFLSVAGFVDTLYKRGEPEEIEAYFTFHRGYLRRWLGRKVGCDVVVEGYDMIREPYRQMVVGVLRELGWGNPEEVALCART